MRGNIQLGKFGDATLRDYVLVDIARYQGSTANPFAAKVSTGGKYADLDMFNDWTVQEWKMGVGYRNPEQGPLFSICDSRFTNQAILPLAFDTPYSLLCLSGGNAGDTNLTNLDLTPTRWYATSFTTANDGLGKDVTEVWVYIRAQAGATVTVRLYSNTSNAPGTLLSSGTAISAQNRPHAHWMKVTITSQALAANTRYHIAVNSNSASGDYLPSIRVTGQFGTTSTNGTTWTTNTVGGSAAGFQFLISNYLALSFFGAINHMAYAGSKLYAAANNYFYDPSDVSVSYNTGANDITDLLAVDTDIWIAYTTGYAIFHTTTATIDYYLTSPTKKFALFNGYIWRCSTRNVYYSADGTTWTDVGVVPSPGSQVRAMAGIDQNLYCACDDGLYMIAAGDYVVQVCRWPEKDARNGTGMCAWEGALYIPLVSSIMRFDSSGALMNVGPNASEELPKEVRGRAWTLVPTSHFLLASMRPLSSTGYASLWAYNVEGWHCLCLGPQSADGGDIVVDPDNDYLYWGLQDSLLLRFYYPTTIYNPIRDLSSMVLAREGWIEYEKYIGGYLSLDKDFRKIVLDNEGTAGITVYWKDPESTDWELLGTVGAGYNSLGWDTVGASGRWIKLGLKFTTKTPNTTPILRGFALKYSSVTTDRWRWVLPVLISDKQQLADGGINAYTAEQQNTHIKELIAEVLPLQFVDIDGTAHTVKVTGASVGLVRYEWEAAKATPAADLQLVYTLQLEEV